LIRHEMGGLDKSVSPEQASKELADTICAKPDPLDNKENPWSKPAQKPGICVIL